MGADELNDDGLGGRTRDRREFTEANRWAIPLVSLDPVELAGAPLPDEVMEAVRLGREITSYRARDRQYQRIDKLVRGLEEEEIEAIDRFLKNPRGAWKQLDGWVARMEREGDAAIDAWVAEYPGTDRQRVRTLARRAKGGDPSARNALWEQLREILREI